MRAGFTFMVDGKPTLLTHTSIMAKGMEWEAAKHRETVGARAPSMKAQTAIHAAHWFLNVGNCMRPSVKHPMGSFMTTAKARPQASSSSLGRRHQ